MSEIGIIFSSITKMLKFNQAIIILGKKIFLYRTDLNKLVKYFRFFLFYSASVFSLKSVALIPPIGKYLVRKCESFSGGSAGVCCSFEAWQWVASQDQEDYFNIEYCVTEPTKHRIPHRLFTWDHTTQAEAESGYNLL